MSQTSTTTEPDIDIHPVVKTTSAFSDRLSPMLVKELRQGLKGMSFLILFIAIQAILGVFIFGSAFSDSYDNTGGSISRTVFFCLSMATLIVQPLRGVSSVATEIKDDTIDLMVLTKLSAWRIVFGKWISLVSQSALIIAAVSPYLILRYFFGGMQLFPEIMVLVTIFLLSASLTAITVGLSAIPSFIVRGIIGLGIASAAFSISMAIVDRRSNFRDLLEFCGFANNELTAAYFSTIASAIYLAWLALDFGATYIAPAAENRSTPRRFICLGVLAIISIVFIFLPTNVIFTLPIVMMCVAAPVIIISITESIYLVPTISKPFVRKGLLGRAASYFFCPGWQSGLNFCMLIFALTMIVNLMTPEPRYFGSTTPTSLFLTMIPICFSSVLFPLALVRLFFRKTHQHFIYYIGACIVTFVLFLLTIFIMENSRSYDLAIIFSWIPPVQGIMYVYAENSWRTVAYTTEVVTVIAYLSLFINWLICFMSTRSSWKYLRENEAVAKASLAPVESN